MVFRTRPTWLVGQAVPNGVIVACAVEVLTAPIASAGQAFVTAPLVFVLGAAVAVPSIRRRRLVADDTGVTAVRNGYQLRTRWDDLVGFEQTRFAVVVPVTTLRLNDATIVSADGRTVSRRRVAKIRKSGADRGIQLSVYVENPRTGRFGELLQQHRPDLAMHT